MDLPRGCGSNPDLPDAGLGGCCMGSAVYGPSRCTCWEPVWPQEQQPARTDLPSSVMPKMCGDCAFRRDSPERTEHPNAAADYEDLQTLVEKGLPFYCHDGMMKPTHYRHPSGVMIEANDLGYDPLRVGDKVYRVDGRPADLCNGWTRRRLAFLQRDVPRVS
jgi:hypothetical protein